MMQKRISEWTKETENNIEKKKRNEKKKKMTKRAERQKKSEIKRVCAQQIATNQMKIAIKLMHAKKKHFIFHSHISFFVCSFINNSKWDFSLHFCELNAETTATI